MLTSVEQLCDVGGVFRFQSMFARNFYNFKLIALALAFLINFILLFFKVCIPGNRAPSHLGICDPVIKAEGSHTILSL